MKFAEMTSPQIAGVDREKSVVVEDGTSGKPTICFNTENKQVVEKTSCGPM